MARFYIASVPLLPLTCKDTHYAEMTARDFEQLAGPFGFSLLVQAFRNSGSGSNTTTHDLQNLFSRRELYFLYSLALGASDEVADLQARLALLYQIGLELPPANKDNLKEMEEIEELAAKYAEDGPYLSRRTADAADALCQRFDALTSAARAPAAPTVAELEKIIADEVKSAPASPASSASSLTHEWAQRFLSFFPAHAFRYVPKGFKDSPPPDPTPEGIRAAKETEATIKAQLQLQLASAAAASAAAPASAASSSSSSSSSSSASSTSTLEVWEGCGAGEERFDLKVLPRPQSHAELPYHQPPRMPPAPAPSAASGSASGASASSAPWLSAREQVIAAVVGACAFRAMRPLLAELAQIYTQGAVG